jgi:hypothetical protein
VADAILADELEGQQREDGLDGGDHPGAGQVGAADPSVEPPGDEGRQQDKQSAGTGVGVVEVAEVELSDVGDVGLVGAWDGGAFVVAAPREPGEAFLAEDLVDGDVADGQSLDGQGLADVVDGVVAFAQGDDAVSGGVAFGGALGAGSGRSEELDASGPKLAAEGVEGLAGVAEAVGDLLGAAPVDEIGAEGFVLALAGVGRAQEELGARPLLGIVSFISHGVYYRLYRHTSQWGRAEKRPKMLCFSRKQGANGGNERRGDGLAA